MQKKKVNKGMCTEFKAKSKSNLKIYIVNSERVVINASDFRKELQEIRTPKLKQLYDITLDIKDATQLIQAPSESEPDHSDNKITFEMRAILRTGITIKIILLKKIKLQTATNTMKNKQRISYFGTTHVIRTLK